MQHPLEVLDYWTHKRLYVELYNRGVPYKERFHVENIKQGLFLFQKWFYLTPLKNLWFVILGKLFVEGSMCIPTKKKICFFFKSEKVQ